MVRSTSWKNISFTRLPLPVVVPLVAVAIEIRGGEGGIANGIEGLGDEDTSGPGGSRIIVLPPTGG